MRRSNPAKNQTFARVTHGVRLVCAVSGAVVAVVAGISTLNMISANYGMASLNEIASPFLRQFGRFDDEV